MSKKILYGLMILPFIITSIILPYLPDTIPAHYNTDGYADRFGSKYETFILPVICFLFGLLILFIAGITSKSENNHNHNNEKITLIVGNCVLFMFNILMIYILFTSFYGIVLLSEVPIDFAQIEFICLGITCIIIGNIMPKLKNNSIIGFRTGKTMANEENWKKAQRFGGITCMVTGLLMIIGCLFFFKEVQAFVYSMILLFLMVIIDLIYSAYL